MRATPLLAAVAAGLISIASAVAQEAPGRNSSPAAGAIPQPTLIVSVPSAEPAAKAVGGDKAADGTSAASPAAVSEPAAAPVVRKPAPPSLQVKINLSTQRLTLLYNGQSQESWPISSGREGYPTPRGVFRPQWASKMWYSRKYDNAPMPHAVFFTGGVAVHATQSIGNLGQPASHGCVRLAPGNAARFYALVHKYGFANTRIEVLGTPPAPRLARREPAGRERLAAGASMRGAGMRSPAMSQRPAQAWLPPSQQQPVVRRNASGLVYLPPGSPYRGQTSFVMNGVTYVRVR